jgi:hypothetical protein
VTAVKLATSSCTIANAASRLGIHEPALQSMAGVVDQDIDRNASLLEAPMQLDDCRNIREIDLLRRDVDAVLPA